jgi:xanthine dehydrogenase accessory factor
MTEDMLRRAADLADRGIAHALATVVAVDRPVSARSGDRAVVTADGNLEGWIGGSCSEPLVIREGVAALRDGRPRLLRIRPPGSPREPERPGVVTEVTTCASEGGLDVFVEPHLPRPRLLVAGSSPAARMVARIAVLMGYRVTAVLDDPTERVPDAGYAIDIAALARCELGSSDAVVVATMNRYDGPALEAALQTGAGYIGVVASKGRGAALLELLSGRGVGAERLDAVRVPAGLDLGTSSQEEIALAVVAEIVAERHKKTSFRPEAVRPCDGEALEATDPVCGMSVPVVPGAISATVDGNEYYFCGPGCRAAFLLAPASFASGGPATT